MYRAPCSLHNQKISNAYWTNGENLNCSGMESSARITNTKMCITSTAIRNLKQAERINAFMN